MLERRKQVLILYLLSKVEDEDWHGVADAAMDLREIDIEIKLTGSPHGSVCT